MKTATWKLNISFSDYVKQKHCCFSLPFDLAVFMD